MKRDGKSTARRPFRVTTPPVGCPCEASRALSRLAAILVVFVALLSTNVGEALGVVGGHTVSITAAPWSVVVREGGQMVCTGVIIDSRHILTAEHCIMSGESATPQPASEFTIEAGVSNFNRPLPSDHPQTRGVSVEHLIPGYIASSRKTYRNVLDADGHDLAVLTLARPLDLSGDDARAASLPSANSRNPSGATRVVMAGFGNEKPSESAENGDAYGDGTLNEVARSTVWPVCSTARVICVFATTGTCWGDSGAGLVEPGPHPTVVGILSSDQPDCHEGLGGYMALTSPAVLHFIGTGR